jgi:hypothetical protein
VKLIGRVKDGLELQLPLREKDLLWQLLRLYPRIPSNYPRLSKGAGLQASSQHLLEEALAESRGQNQHALQTLLNDPKRLKPHEGGGWRLKLSNGDVEWLLQVLNDIRVGSWIQLGSPESPLRVLNADTAPDVWAMEMAGSFQMRLLEIIEG